MIGAFRAQLTADQQRVEERLADVLSGNTELARAMRHAVLNGGKRLRAFLVYEGARICGLEAELADFGAEAIELIHAYSLVHDDLPCMDDDDLRRGQPTVHVKWNEYTAVLAGDALQALAFEQLADAPLKPENSIKLIKNLSHFAGMSGMVGGQYLDLEAEKQDGELTLADLQNLQKGKTGALIRWSAEYGAIAAGQDAAAFGKFAEHLGLAFQIWDDVLDVEASSAVLGKTAGKDEKSGKATYVSLLGLENAKSHAKSEIEAAKAAISKIQGSENLSQLADFVITRSY